MKLNKIFLLASIAFMGLFAASCSDDDYTPGKPAGAFNVGFSSADEANLNIALEDMEFPILLKRTSAEDELTVPIQILKAPACMQVPASATFAKGETETEIVVKLDTTMKAFQQYELTLSIPEEYTNPYKTDDYPIYNITVLKEDYVAYKNIWYFSGFEPGFYETNEDGEYPLVLEYSEYLKLYRIKDFQTPGSGSNLYFKWDGEFKAGGITLTDADGKAIGTSQFPTGFSYDPYGAVSLKLDADNAGDLGYYPEDGTFYLPFKWCVSAGTFSGVPYDYFYFDE